MFSAVGPDGDVHVPQWLRNIADPLGLGLLPTDDQINASNHPDSILASQNDDFDDILDRTPQTKEEARLQLKALYNVEPTVEAVNDYWHTLEGEVESDRRASVVTKDGQVVSDDPDFLNKNPEAITWNQYRDKTSGNPEFYKAPDGTIISDSSQFLKKNRQALTWKQYIRKMQKGNTFYTADDGQIVSDDPQYLKKNRKAISWKEYVQKASNSKKNFFVTPDGTRISEDAKFLKENPDAMTWD